MTESDNAFFIRFIPVKISFDKPAQIRLTSRLLAMKTTFATSMTKHTPVNGWMAICLCYSRTLGVVGVKF